MLWKCYFKIFHMTWASWNFIILWMSLLPFPLFKGFFHTLNTFRPAALAAESCWMSEETKASASNSKAQAICNASRDRTLLVSRMWMDCLITERVILQIRASSRSLNNACFAISYWSSVITEFLLSRHNAEIISGKQIELTPNITDCEQIFSTLSLPGSTIYRFANAEESKKAFIS